ncbi:folylpolyglutamate synthase/dihydrofolate synthase family protein [Fusobacterium sp.]|uniref:bifunctional folylpolyglutamate synthase/dihydrofolate synthase n=2 Tax=Fusobacterium sp. TaxID=68766 RepID=UPI002613F062|nr:folylpolyglutamate synthase/dihydrofolate synthase family protein [Fusobacterium sp.]
MEIKELLDELYSYSLFGIKLGLENIQKICDYFGNPEKKYKVIHITGTNGKGSTSTIIETVLLEAGYSVGKYTSPHILKFNERIRANGEDISDRDIAILYEKVKNAIKEINITPTFFEVTTAMMFLYFAEKKVDYAVLEVGMGGRFDATNVSDGDISIITNVSLDHTEYLGKNIYDIALEKAGIIKKKSKVIVGDDNEEFLRAIYTKKQDIVNVVEKYRDITYNLDFKNFITEINIGENRYNLSLFGDYQVKNFLCAYEALKELGIKEEIIKEAVSKVVWQCRFERFSSNPLVVLEGAHNIDGINNLKKILEKEYKTNEIVMIVSILKDKKVEEMLKVCSSLSDKIILTSLSDNPRGLSGEKLLDYTDKSSIFMVEDDMKKAYEKAREFNRRIVVVCGSFYTCEKFKKEI